MSIYYIYSNKIIYITKIIILIINRLIHNCSISMHGIKLSVLIRNYSMQNLQNYILMQRTSSYYASIPNWNNSINRGEPI